MALEHIRLLNKIFSIPNLPSGVYKVKAEAYKNACESARICRGNNIFTKIFISLVSLYYSPTSYTSLFIGYRLGKLRKFVKDLFHEGENKRKFTKKKRP